MKRGSADADTAAAPADAETPLRGGMTHAGRVSRVGSTVRRPWRTTTPATHALLAHLERAGFDGAPRFLESDEQGREVLSYVEGDVPIEPYPAWSLTDAALVSVAELLRRYHDAVAGFDPTPHSWPLAVPAPFRGALASHNDPNLHNVVFAGGRAVAFVDFDLAGPGSAVWDVACAGRLWAPLGEDADAPEPVRGRSLERLRVFVEAYGVPEGDRTRVVDALLPAHDADERVVRAAVADGHPGFSDRWRRDGGRERAERTRRWIAAHDHELRTALTRAA